MDAHPGQITRIDLFQMPAAAGGELRVMKWAEGWTIGTPPVKNYLTGKQTLVQACAWLEQNGWTVHRWPGGARAWLGQVQPIRSRGQILRKRDELTRFRQLHPEQQLNTLNLALDY